MLTAVIDLKTSQRATGRDHDPALLLLTRCHRYACSLPHSRTHRSCPLISPATHQHGHTGHTNGYHTTSHARTRLAMAHSTQTAQHNTQPHMPPRPTHPHMHAPRLLSANPASTSSEIIQPHLFHTYLHTKHSHLYDLDTNRPHHWPEGAGHAPPPQHPTPPHPLPSSSSAARPQLAPTPRAAPAAGIAMSQATPEKPRHTAHEHTSACACSNPYLAPLPPDITAPRLRPPGAAGLPTISACSASRSVCCARSMLRCAFSFASANRCS